ncbi:MAG: hypothetical protein PHS79_02090 [Patescibacteria group bacterium]|nr:hypothetical protein [Patescibacteria group bacterium]
MNKKYFYGSLILIIGIVFVWQLAANAQTWNGPAANCYDPSQSGCNVDGVIWSRSAANIDTAPVQMGGYKINGRAEIGDDLKIANNFYVTTDGKAIRIDRAGSSSFNIGNWGNGVGSEQPVNLNVWGNLITKGNGTGFTDPKVISPKYCFADASSNPINCIQAWPAASGAGDVTDVLFTAPITVTTPGGPQPRVALTTCAANQIYKMSGGVWTCSADADTNSGGTISNLSSSNNSISITNAAGPNTVLTANNVYFDDRYVNVSGDTMAGNFSSPFGNTFGLSAGNWLLSVQPAANTIYTIGTLSHTGAINSSGNITVTGAGQVKASTLCIGNDCRAAWPNAGTGDVTDVLSGTGITVTNSGGPQPSVKISSCVSNGQVMQWDQVNSAWACVTPITNVQAGNGLTGGGTSGVLTVNVGGGTGISVAADGVNLDTAYTDNRYVNNNTGLCTTVALAWPNRTISCPSGRYVAGVVTGLASPAITSVTCCPLHD